MTTWPAGADHREVTEGTRAMTRLTVALFVALTLAFGVSTSASAQDIDCPQITGDEADAILAADPSDPNDLDRDNDGFPCEDNARRGGGGSAAPAASSAGSSGGGGGGGGRSAAVTVVPATGAGPLGGNGTSGALVALFGLAGVSALAALRTRSA